MELKTFISTSLVQIAKGIESAATELDGTSAIVNPSSVSVTGKRDDSVFGYIEKPGAFKRTVQEITFDVAVTAAEGKETKGGIGIMVGVVALGSQGKSGTEQSSYSRIQFKVPMALPVKE